MLNGLEVTELKLSKVIASAITFRLDSDYYRKQYLCDEAVISNYPNKFLKLYSLGLEVDGSAFYPALEPYYGLGNFPFIRVADVKSYVDFDSCARIPKEILPQFPTLKIVRPGDIVLTKGGSIARAGLITQEGAASRDLIFVNSSKLSEAEYTYLTLYFQTDFCKRLLVRSSSMSVQPHLTLTLVKDVAVFKTTEAFQNKLLKVIVTGRQRHEQSKILYAEAESILLEELGLINWQPPEETVAVKAFGESFGVTGRIDAEFYQPRYQETLAKLRRSGMRIRNVATLSKRNFNPKGISAFKYIEIGSLTGEGIAEPEEVLIQDAPSRAQWIVKKGDVITSTVRPIRRLSALIGPEQDGDICSSGFAVLIPQQVEPEVLLTFLRAPIVCEILDLYTTASMYPAISTDDLLNIPITLPSISAREKIVRGVQNSRQARCSSKALLEIAKRGVEIAIEQDETTALTWMDVQKRQLDVS